MIFPDMNKLYMIFISKNTSYIPCLVKHGNVSDVIYISRVKNLQKFTKKLLVTTSQLQNLWLYNFFFEIWRGWDSNPRTPKRKDILYDDLESFSVDRASIPLQWKRLWIFTYNFFSRYFVKSIWGNNLKTKFIIILRNFNSWQQLMTPRIWDQE